MPGYCFSSCYQGACHSRSCDSSSVDLCYHFLPLTAIVISCIATLCIVLLPFKLSSFLSWLQSSTSRAQCSIYTKRRFESWWRFVGSFFSFCLCDWSVHTILTTPYVINIPITVVIVIIRTSSLSFDALCNKFCHHGRQTGHCSSH